MDILNGRSEVIGVCDDEDAHLLEGCSFTLAPDADGGRVYIRATRAGRTRPFHRLLLDPPAPFVVDHINRDGTDNRRSNLRVATESQNQGNSPSRRGSSQYKGVYLRKKDGRYVAGIAKKFLGSFDLEEDAARCYDAAAVERWGEYARLNFAGVAQG